MVSTTFLNINQTKSFAQIVETDSTDIFDYRIKIAKDNGIASNISILFSYSKNSIKKIKRKLKQTKDSTLDYSILYAASPHNLKTFDKRIREVKYSSFRGDIIYFYVLSENDFLTFGKNR